jgi:hypothetical protein
MARKNLLYGVTAAGLAGIMAVTALYLVQQFSTNQTTSLSSALSASDLPAQYRLYSGARDASGKPITSVDSGWDVTDQHSGVARFRYLKNKDGSTEDITLKPDGEQFARREIFYPETGEYPSASPADIGRHLHVVQIYSTVSDKVLDETIYRFNGTTEEHTDATDAGAKHIVDYGQDGATLVHELLIGAGPYKFSDPVLHREERWREDTGHTLSYSNLYDPSTKARTITDWDELHRQLKVTFIPEWGGSGTTTIAYWPGTTQVRMSAKVEMYTNIASYFRKDGTLDHVLKLSFAGTTIDYYDPTGKDLGLEQWWDRKDTFVNGEHKLTYTLSTVRRMDAKGSVTRKLSYWNGKLGVIEDYNVDIDGVHYGEIDTAVDGATNTVSQKTYWIGKPDHVFDKKEVHKPEDKIAPPFVAPEDLAMRCNPDEDNELVIPDPPSDER